MAIIANLDDAGRLADLSASTGLKVEDAQSFSASLTRLSG
jgi:hypothetical protein